MLRISNLLQRMLPLFHAVELHLVAAKRNGKLYFPQTVMLVYLGTEKQRLVPHSGQLSQWNKVRRIEYSHRTKHTRHSAGAETTAGIPLGVQDEQNGDRQEWDGAFTPISHACLQPRIISIFIGKTTAAEFTHQCNATANNCLCSVCMNTTMSACYWK